MIRIKWIAVLLVLLAMGCAKEESAVVENLDFDTLTAEFDTFTAGFADANTKTYVDENLRLFWHEKDEISIFTSTLNAPYQFKGKTGDNSGTFKNISTDFGTGATSLPLNYAVYPYLENTAISYDGEITLELPAEQCYVENSFGRGANSMVAVTSTKQDLFLPFKNLCGYLKLKIYGENVGIKSIELKGNSNEILSGFSKVIAKYGTDPNLTTSKDGGKTITLKTPDGGVELGTSSENATEFWFVIPPITFTKGITVTVVDVWGNKTTKSTSNEIVIERNIVKAMEPFKVEFEGETYESRILYTTSDNKAISVYEVNFNAAIVSNIYDEEKGEGTITFKGQLTEIKEGAFRVKTTLTSISIPEGVTKLGGNLFESCIRLANISLPETLNAIPSGFVKNCSKLKSLLIKEGVTIIDPSAFEGCSSLASIAIPESITTIGERAFSGCSSLVGIKIPEGVTIIADDTFYGCRSVESISIPKSITAIGERAFYGCSSLKGVEIPEGVTIIADDTFYDCRSMESVVIPKSVTAIGERAFYGCSSFKGVEIPVGVTSVGSSAFACCENLASVVIPEGIVSIEEGTFNGCVELTQIVIPEGVAGIGSLAFSNCSNLKVVTSHCEDAPNIEYDTFSGVTATLMVLKGYGNSYKASLWGESFSNILEIADYTTYTDLSEPGSANCYLVQEAGDYKFRAVKGNSSISVGDVAYAEVLWESLGTDITPLEGYLIATAGYIDGDIVFSTPETFSSGNAVIAAKDASGRILWSWHIWCSDEGWTDHVYANNAGTMMDRNLGATSATPGDVGALGLLYQWGRKDPFLGSCSISEKILAASTGDWEIVSTSDWERFNGGYPSISFAIENPMVFISGSSDWCLSYSEDCPNEQRWMDSQKTIYDPCPVGYRVPKGGQDGFWAVAEVGSENDETNKGIYWTLANGTVAWYPSAGSLNRDGTLIGVGNNGSCWSATTRDETHIWEFWYYTSSDILLYDTEPAVKARSVRCVRE